MSRKSLEKEVEEIERRRAERVNINVIHSMQKTLASFIVQSELLSKEYMNSTTRKMLLEVVEGFERVLKKLKEYCKEG